MLLTAGTVADCTPALALLADIPAEHLWADQGYDTNHSVAQARELGMPVVIPSQSNRREAQEYDRHWYRLRRLVENGFCDCKQSRSASPHHARKAASFPANCQIRAIALWTKII